MPISPIVHRELRVCLRRADLRRWRNRRVYGVTMVAMALLLFEAVGFRAFQFAGFWIYAFTALLAGVLPMSRCVGLIREEREAQTFPLLRLAGIRPLEFFIGKALSGLWLTTYELIGLVPLIALPLIAGGFGYTDFLDMLASLPAIAVASIGLTLFASAVCREEFAAEVVLYVLVSGWCLGVLLVHGVGRMATGVAPFGPEVLWISPLYAASIVGGSGSPATRADLWRSIGLMWFVGLATLSAAALWLNWTWKRDEPEAATSAARCRRLVEPTDPAFARTWNPIEAWVASESRRLRWAYVGLALLAVFWTSAAVVWGRAWIGSLMGILIILFVSLSTASTTGILLAAKVARERRNGTFEAILGTSVEPEEVVDGYVLGFRRLVRPFQLAAAGFAIVVWFAGLLSREWNSAALISYIFIGVLLIGMLLSRGIQDLYGVFHAAFASGRAGAAMGRASGLGMASLVNLIHVYRLIDSVVTSGKLPEFPTGSMIETVLVILAGVGLLIAWVAMSDKIRPSRYVAFREMRRLLQEPPLSKDDPRWKSWKNGELNSI